MKFLLTFIGLLFFYLEATAQSVPRLRQLGEELYEKEQYFDAIEYFEKVTEIDKKDLDTRFKLAIALFKTFQFQEAKEQLKYVINSDSREQSAEALLFYGNILKLNEKYSEADSAFSILLKNYDVDEDILKHARKEREGCLLAINQLLSDRNFPISLSNELNSEYHDFGISVNREKRELVYLSTRNVSSQQMKSGQFRGLLPDLIKVSYRKGKWQNTTSKDNFDRLNSKWAEGSGSFTKKGDRFYFTSCNDEEGGSCKIMLSRHEKGEWTEPVPLNKYINEKGSINKHPYVTASGDTLFFSSDRPGGFGGSDLWMSIKGLSDESWTPAINLGEVVNTPYDEITPFFSSAYNCLIFASNGHVGYGGFDLFAAKGESFFEPNIYNAGPPFNSALDDTYFYIYDSVGFFSSNRADRVHLNNYTFDVNDERLYLSLLISGESLIDSRVISRYKQIRSIDLTTFRIEDFQGFELFDPVKRKKPKPDILKEKPFSERTDESGETIIVASNQPQSSYKENSAPERNYTAEIISGTRAVDQTKYQIPYELIFFGFARKELGMEAKISLNALARQLDSQSGIYDHLEIRVYTDPVGPASYNLTLSQERGRRVADYLVSKGIDNVKIKVVPLGETNLLSQGENWYDNFFNRRAEILINTNRKIDLNKAYKLLVRRKIDLSRAAQLLRIDPDKIRKWNNDDDSFDQGDIIRIEERLSVAPDIHYFIDHLDIKNDFFRYRLQPGESLSSVAQKFDTPEELLLEINNLKSLPKAGDQIYVYRIE